MQNARAETLKYLRYLNMAGGIFLFKQMTPLWQTHLIDYSSVPIHS